TGARDFAACVGARVDCRVCVALRATYRLSTTELECDRFDDGIANASCDAGGEDSRASCGDGVVQPARGEECDDRNHTNGDGCSDGCIIEHCGDGWVDTDRGEQCDDGNNEDGDGCSAACRIGAGDGCVTDCRVEGECGDGVIQRDRGETCDDGNTVDGDG